MLPQNLAWRPSCGAGSQERTKGRCGRRRVFGPCSVRGPVRNSRAKVFES
jgi:hypothetical protein